MWSLYYDYHLLTAYVTELETEIGLNIGSDHLFQFSKTCYYRSVLDKTGYR